MYSIISLTMADCCGGGLWETGLTGLEYIFPPEVFHFFSSPFLTTLLNVGNRASTSKQRSKTKDIFIKIKTQIQLILIIK